MTHKQVLFDYKTLQNIAGGFPYDAGEKLEAIAINMIEKPNTKEAKKHLVELIELFFYSGGPAKESLLNNDEAVEIFSRYNLI